MVVGTATVDISATGVVISTSGPKVVSSLTVVKSITTVVVSGAKVEVTVTSLGEGRLKKVVCKSDSVVTVSTSTISVTAGVSVVRSNTVAVWPGSGK